MKKSMIVVTALLIILGASTLTPVGQNLSVRPMVKVQGNKFVGPDGKEMVFRGLALSDPDKLQKNGHWDEAYFKMAADWGANIVRIPVHPAAWRERGPKNYITLLDQGVEWAKKYKLLVIIDWHSIGNLKTELFQDDMYDTTMKETLTFWRTIASHFKNEPTVAFYEIFNEPTTYNGQLGGMTWSEWKSIAEVMINLIYAHDQKVIPLVGGLDWAYDLTSVASDPIMLPGIGYTVHPYPQKRPEPWAPRWDGDFGFVKNKYPLFITEFGFERVGFIPCIATPKYGKQIMDYSNRKGISWTVWCFDPDWTPKLISDWNFTPTEQGEFFRAVMQGKDVSGFKE